ncbi:uncharacterized protein LOC110355908 isoform X1 [Columba livia]|uniref:uncharacterized protein LOC110355908 isoform X1 n=2 Tax=Columba livia TaxID=8932 RepID=UPI0031B9B9D1
MPPDLLCLHRDCVTVALACEVLACLAAPLAPSSPPWAEVLLLPGRRREEKAQLPGEPRHSPMRRSAPPLSFWKPSAGPAAGHQCPFFPPCFEEALWKKISGSHVPWQRLCHLFLLFAAVKLKARASVSQPAGVSEPATPNVDTEQLCHCQTGPIKKCCSGRSKTPIAAFPTTHPRKHLRHPLLATVGDKIPALMNLLPERHSCSCRTMVCEGKCDQAPICAVKLKTGKQQRASKSVCCLGKRRVFLHCPLRLGRGLRTQRSWKCLSEFCDVHWIAWRWM